MDLSDYIDKTRKLIYETIDEEIPKLPGKKDSPEVFARQAMRYLITNKNGSLSRPLLLKATSDMYGISDSISLPLGFTAEAIHCASLILDDLGCMDDARTRRGKRCTHLQYGNATANMVVHKLKDLATQIIIDSYLLDSDVIIALSSEIGSTSLRMFEGQNADLRGKDTSIEALIQMYSDKTSALLSYSLAAPAIVAEEEEEVEILKEIGNNLGIWYQINDDIMDISMTSKEAGKTTGTDEKSLVVVHGMDIANRLKMEYYEKTIEGLESLSGDNEILSRIIKHKMESSRAH